MIDTQQLNEGRLGQYQFAKSQSQKSALINFCNSFQLYDEFSFESFCRYHAVPVEPLLF